MCALVYSPANGTSAKDRKRAARHLMPYHLRVLLRPRRNAHAQPFAREDGIRRDALPRGFPLGFAPPALARIVRVIALGHPHARIVPGVARRYRNSPEYTYRAAYRRAGAILSNKSMTRTQAMRQPRHVLLAALILSSGIALNPGRAVSQSSPPPPTPGAVTIPSPRL